MEKINLQELKTAYPEFVGQIEKEALDKGDKAGYDRGKAEGLTQGAGTEKKRIQEVEAQAIPGHEVLVKELMYDGKTTGAEAAMKILAAERVVKEETLKAIKEGRIKPVKQSNVSVEDGGIDPNLPLDQRAKAVWDKSPEVRAEFLDNFNSYLGYLRATEAGRVKILKKENEGGKK